MKKILLITASLLIASAVGAQNDDPIYYRPPKKTKETTIIAWSPLSASINYKKAVKACFSQGFGIHHADSTLGMITTVWKDLGKTNSNIQVTALAEDDRIIFRAQLIVNATINLGYASSNPSNSTVSNYGGRGSPNRLAWEALENVARTVSDSLTYK